MERVAIQITLSPEQLAAAKAAAARLGMTVTEFYRHATRLALADAAGAQRDADALTAAK